MLINAASSAAEHGTTLSVSLVGRSRLTSSPNLAQAELEGQVPRVKAARAKSCKESILILLEAKGGGLIPGFQGNILHQGHKHGLSHMRNMRLERLD